MVRPPSILASLGVVGLGLALIAAQRVGQFLLRLSLAGGLAALGGIFIGAAVTDGGLGQLIVTGLAAFALWPPLLIGLNRLSRWRRDRTKRQPLDAHDKMDLPGGGRADAWTRLHGETGRDPRLIQARATIDSISGLLTRLPLDPEAHELRILIDKRLPELIDARLDHVAMEEPRARAEGMADLIDLIACFADDSRERCDRLAGRIERRDLVLRRRIETHLSQGREQPF